MSNQALSFIAPSVIILTLVVVIAAIVFLIVRVRRGQPFGLAVGTILTAYFYFISLLSIIIFAGGLSTLVSAGLTIPFGKEFTYQRYPIMPVVVPPPPPTEPGAPYPAKPVIPSQPSVEEQQRQQELRIQVDFRRDLVGGGILSLVSLAVWLGHSLGRRRLEKGSGSKNPFMGRAYNILLLAFFSIASLIILTGAVQQMVNYYIYTPQDVNFYGPRQAPGGSIAQVIVFVPIWILSLRSVLKGRNNHVAVSEGENGSEKSQVHE